MAVTAIRHRATRERPTPLRRASMLLLVVAWAAVFAAAYALGTRAHATRSAAPATLAPGAPVSTNRSAPSVRATRTGASSHHHVNRVSISGLSALPAPPTLKPRVAASVIATVRAPVYRAPVYRSAPAVAAPTPAPATTAPTTTGGGPHGSGGGGGGTTTVGTGSGSTNTGTSGSNSGGGGLGSGTTGTGTTPGGAGTPTGTTSTGIAPGTGTTTGPSTTPTSTTPGGY